MIEREHRDQFIACDSCSAYTEPYDHDDFNRMIADAKENGWRIRLRGGEWGHTCPNCQGAAEDFA